jgi:hypothetical protein
MGNVENVKSVQPLKGKAIPVMLIPQAREKHLPSFASQTARSKEQSSEILFPRLRDQNDNAAFGGTLQRFGELRNYL